MISQSRSVTEVEMWRERILDVAEEHFRRIGFQKTTVADIASCLGMSSANIYRFFPSRAAINKSICGRFIAKATRLADAVARLEAPAHEKLESLFKLLHEERRKNFVEEKPVHDLIAAATAESWPVISAHSARLVAIIENIIEEGTAASTFKVIDAAIAARSAMNAFAPFYHPVLVEERVRNAGNAGDGIREQVVFILQALGRDDENRLSGSRQTHLQRMEPQ
ncbi:TetR/AcrR family transcriptional regulator [Rhizobium pisi]|uniref:TetR/AcrR family transcriptional regulator n=1 Tax=Rhizobium pisi TaxID=574561 RepID=UPI0039B0C08E